MFDGDCSFCRRSLVLWRRIVHDRVDAAPFQEVAERFPEIPREQFREALHLRERDGRWARGAEAVFRSLAHAPGAGGGFWLYRRVPGFAGLSELGYRGVARGRPVLDPILALFVADPGRRGPP